MGIVFGSALAEMLISRESIYSSEEAFRKWTNVTQREESGALEGVVAEIFALEAAELFKSECELLSFRYVPGKAMIDCTAPVSISCIVSRTMSRFPTGLDCELPGTAGLGP